MKIVISELHACIICIICFSVSCRFVSNLSDARPFSLRLICAGTGGSLNEGNNYRRSFFSTMLFHYLPSNYVSRFQSVIRIAHNTTILYFAFPPFRYLFCIGHAPQVRILISYGASSIVFFPLSSLESFLMFSILYP